MYLSYFRVIEFTNFYEYILIYLYSINFEQINYDVVNNNLHTLKQCNKVFNWILSVKSNKKVIESNT